MFGFVVILILYALIGLAAAGRRHHHIEDLLCLRREAGRGKKVDKRADIWASGEVAV
jgi:hypothetical protein